MRRIAVLLVIAALAGAQPAAAAETKCALDVKTCIDEFAKMKTRPWIGIMYDTDSTTGTASVMGVVPGGPAEKAGLRTGDVLLKIEDASIGDTPRLLAGKAGWRVGKVVRYRIRRAGEEQDVPVTLGRVSDEQLARMIGTHMVEAHLAYADTAPSVH